MRIFPPASAGIAIEWAAGSARPAAILLSLPDMPSTVYTHRTPFSFAEYVQLALLNMFSWLC
jgi:hypothetical protein